MERLLEEPPKYAVALRPLAAQLQVAPGPAVWVLPPLLVRWELLLQQRGKPKTLRELLGELLHRDVFPDAPLRAKEARPQLRAELDVAQEPEVSSWRSINA